MIHGKRALLPTSMLMLVTDSTRRPSERPEWIVDVVREAVLGGVNAVQLREKHLSRAALIDLGLHVRDVCTDRALFFVNGDVEAARTLAAHGVHLPEDAPSVAEIRSHVGEGMLISRSVHSWDAAIAAEREGASFVVLGTVFETASKPGAPPLGIEGVRRVCENVRIPVVAIGGITPERTASVLGAGAAGIAVIGAIFDAPSPHDAAAALRKAMRV